MKIFIIKGATRVQKSEKFPSFVKNAESAKNSFVQNKSLVIFAIWTSQKKGLVNDIEKKFDRSKRNSFYLGNFNFKYLQFLRVCSVF